MGYSGHFKVWATLLAAILLALILFTAAFTTGAGAQEAGCSGKVVLDPGHGGKDDGAVSANGLREKDQTLLIANRLKTLLEGDGCTVYMTREDDTYLTNTQRANRANSTGAAILISIHLNAASNPSTDYTTTLYGKPRKDKELADAVFGGSVKPPSYGMRTLLAANGAGTIATRTPYQFASGVLLKSNMPATIAETVFISNGEEAGLLSDASEMRQLQIAEALKSGIEHYLVTHQ
jgi:N-acetylmuramoyl-L-alanine amidase